MNFSKNLCSDVAVRVLTVVAKVAAAVGLALLVFSLCCSCSLHRNSVASAEASVVAAESSVSSDSLSMSESSKSSSSTSMMLENVRFFFSAPEPLLASVPVCSISLPAASVDSEIPRSQPAALFIDKMSISSDNSSESDMSMDSVAAVSKDVNVVKKTASVEKVEKKPPAVDVALIAGVFIFIMLALAASAFLMTRMKS